MEKKKVNRAGTEAKPLSAVSRTFIILEKLSQVSSSSLEDLARLTKLAKPTVYRFLLTLRQLGYVRKGDGDRWFVTMKLFAVGSRALDHIEIPQVARPLAEQLSNDLGETVHLGVLDDDQALYVLKIESKYNIRMYSRVGKRVPLYCTAMGKILLADMEEEELKARLRDLKLVPFTPHTIRNKEELLKELELVRKRGYSMDQEEHEEGIICVASGVRDYSGKTIAALSVSWPKFRYEAAQEEAYGQRIRSAAGELSSILGAL